MSGLVRPSGLSGGLLPAGRGAGTEAQQSQPIRKKKLGKQTYDFLELPRKKSYVPKLSNCARYNSAAEKYSIPYMLDIINDSLL